MGLDDIVKKGKDLFEQNRDKIDEARKSEKAEEISDSVLDGASGLARKIVPDAHHDKIDGARERLDRSIGNE